MQPLIAILLGLGGAVSIFLGSFLPIGIIAAVTLVVALVNKVSISTSSIATIAKNKWLWIVLTVPVLAGIIIWWIISPSAPPNDDQSTKKPTRWYLHWEKPPSYDGFNRYEREKTSPIAMTLTDNILVLQQFYVERGRKEVCVYTLRRENANSRTFVGTWKQERPAISGKITLTFLKDFLSANGWQTMSTDNPPVNIPTRVWRE